MSHTTTSIDLADYHQLPGCPEEDNFGGDAAWLTAIEQFILGRQVTVHDPDYGPIDCGTIDAVTIDAIADVTAVEIRSDQSGKTYNYEVSWVELDPAL